MTYVKLNKRLLVYLKKYSQMNIKEKILSVISMKDEVAEELAQSFHREVYTKKTLIEKNNTFCRKLYFVEKGMARLFYEKDGKDISGWFAVEGNFITCNDSFLNRKPTLLNLEILEPSVLYSINEKELLRLFKYPEMEKFARIVTYNILTELSERIYSTLFQPAEKRYQLLLVRMPEVALRAPLGNIASYLGISQETLSRIRSQQLSNLRSKEKFSVYK